MTFDQAPQSLGYRVIALDPLSECIESAQRRMDPASTEVLEAGPWSQDGHSTFCAPRVAGHHSWSAVNLQETAVADTVDFAVVELRSPFDQYPYARGASPLLLEVNIQSTEDAVLFHLADEPVLFDANWIHPDSLSQVRLRSPVGLIRQLVSATKLRGQVRGLSYRVARYRSQQTELVTQVDQ